MTDPMAHTGDADLVFTGGGVYTVDAARRWAQAVAVKGEHVVAVGTHDQISDWIGPRTEVMDLQGRMLLPGFQDSHVHAPSGGASLLLLDLSACGERDEYPAVIRRYADGSDDPWVLGGGWVANHFPDGVPTAAELDALVPDRPALLSDRNRHHAWANARALQIAGIDSRTPDPPDGWIHRDGDGVPTGLLAEGAVDLVGRLTPTVTPEFIHRALLSAQSYLHAFGITAWQDALIGGPIPIDESFDVYTELATSGDLSARVVGALWFERGQGLGQLPFLRDRRRTAGEGRFRATSVKVMVDGSCEGRSAAMFEPYLGSDGRPSDNVGMEFFEPDELREAIVALDADDFQAHIHVLGDRACADALDALESAVSINGSRDNRHHLAHLHVVRPQDVPRLRPAGALATLQPLWAAHGPPMDELTIPFLGEPRASWQYPFRTLAGTGTPIAFGSDWPVSSPDPIWGVHVAANRTLPTAHPDAAAWADRGTFIADERLDLPTGIAAYTIGAAYVNHLDDVSGSIEVGKLADLVVLDRNLFEHPVEEIGDTRVLRTIVGGTTVFYRSDGKRPDLQG